MRCLCCFFCVCVALHFVNVISFVCMCLDVSLVIGLFVALFAFVVAILLCCNAERSFCVMCVCLFL